MITTVMLIFFTATK